MSNIQYGLISRCDADTLEKTIDLIAKEFPSEKINITEIGLFDGGTTKGLQEYLSSKKLPYFYIGIDNEKDKPVKELELYYCKLIIGNSTEVYNQLKYGSQHLCFIDGDHSYIGVISDYFAYKDKVRLGGYLCFHDTGKHIKAFKDFQHGDKENPDAYISTRKALMDLGLMPNYSAYQLNYIRQNQYQLVFDDADENDEAGGIVVLKRIF